MTKKDNQSWILNNVNEAEIIIYSKYNNKVLDVKDRNLEDNAIVQLWDINGDLNQRWIIEECGESKNRIKSVLSNKYLTPINWDNQKETMIVLLDAIDDDVLCC